MSSTAPNEILYDSAALYSLKKDQLVQLCKEHTLKTNGTKQDMIDRLVALVSDGTEPRDPEPAVERNIIQLNSIREESNSDFGSMKSSSMSLKSIVSSFGFTRSKSNTSSLTSVAQDTASGSLSGDVVVDNPTPPEDLLKAAEVPLPASPLIESFTPPPNVDARDTIRLVQIPEYTPGSYDTPSRIGTSSYQTYGDTPYLPAFKTSFDLVMDRQIDTPGRDVARMLRGGHLDTPSKTPRTSAVFSFGTPATSSWAFRPSLGFTGSGTDDNIPPVPPLPKLDFGKRAANDSDDEDAMDGVLPSVRSSVMEELMQRAGAITVVPDRDVRPLPRRSLVPGSVPPPKKTEVTNKFEKAHEAMEAKMQSIDAPRGGLAKKRKAEDAPAAVGPDARRKSARVSIAGAHPRASISGPRASGVRPRVSGAGPRASRGRVSAGRRQSRVAPPVKAKKGFFGFVRTLFGTKDQAGQPKEAKPAAEPQPAVKAEPKEAKGSKDKKGMLGIGKSAMGPPKFAPIRNRTATGGAADSTASKGPATRTSSASSATRGSIASGSKSSIPATTSSARGNISSAAKGSVSSTARGSAEKSSTARGSITSTNKGSVASHTRGSIASTTTRGSLAPKASSGSIASVTRSSVASRASASTTTSRVPSSSSGSRASGSTTGRPSASTVAPTTTRKASAGAVTSSRLTQPTQASLAKRASMETPGAGNSLNVRQASGRMNSAASSLHPRSADSMNSRRAATPSSAMSTSSTSSSIVMHSTSSNKSSNPMEPATVPKSPPPSRIPTSPSRIPMSPSRIPSRIFRTPLSPATLNDRTDGYVPLAIDSPMQSRLPVPSPAKGPASPQKKKVVQRTMSGRRPRISRTTVVAKLAERRGADAAASGAASGSGTASGSRGASGSTLQVEKPVVRKSLAPPATQHRSSLAPKAGSKLKARRVRSSVGAAASGKAGILGRRSVGVAKR